MTVVFSIFVLTSRLAGERSKKKKKKKRKTIAVTITNYKNNCLSHFSPFAIFAYLTPQFFGRVIIVNVNANVRCEDIFYPMSPSL